MTRVLLFTGKGGVGKTTLAAATGVRLAGTGRTVLVVSTDPAHSLGDAFNKPLAQEPVEVTAGLSAAHIRARGLVDSSWAALRDQLRDVLAGAGVGAIDAEELTVLPGVEELLALSEVQRLAATGRWDAVIVDCGPTAETLRLLALPEAFAGYLSRLFPGSRSALLGMLGGIVGGHTGTAAAAGAPLGRLATRLAALRDLLTDTERTTVRLILTPERVVVAETRRTVTALALQGIRVDGIIANRLVPRSHLGVGAAARWMRTRRTEQDAVLAEVRQTGDTPVSVVEHRAAEPVGVAALHQLAEQLYRGSDPLATGDAGAPPLLAVTGGGRGPHAEYRLRIALPLQPDNELELARVADELAVTVDGRRRLITLPAVLRRCAVVSAESDDRGVVVRFRPETAMAGSPQSRPAQQSPDGNAAR